MGNNKRIKKIVMIISFPTAIAFVLFVLLINLVAKGTLTVATAIIFVLIICAMIYASLMKLVTGLVGCFSDVSNGIENLTDENNKLKIKYHFKNENTREMVEKIQKMLTDFAVVIKGIKIATKNLGRIVEDFQTSFEEMSAMSSNIKTESEKISENVINQGNMTDDFIETIDSMDKSIGSIATQIEDLTVSAKNMQECNNNADEIMKELVRISQDNEIAVSNINTQTLATNQSVQEIMEAVDIITDIAGQTNLLALNASIEAARAGEQGKGFAVVAEEIRQLAEQSKVSSERISDVVNKLIENSNESVEDTNKLSTAFSVQKEKIEKTEIIFDKLNSEIKTVDLAISEIDRETESVKDSGKNMNSKIATLKESVASNTSSVSNTVNELNTFEESVSKCIKSTEEISAVSNELINYISSIMEKKEHIISEKKNGK